MMHLLAHLYGGLRVECGVKQHGSENVRPLIHRDTLPTLNTAAQPSPLVRRRWQPKQRRFLRLVNIFEWRTSSTRPVVAVHGQTEKVEGGSWAGNLKLRTYCGITPRRHSACYLLPITWTPETQTQIQSRFHEGRPRWCVSCLEIADRNAETSLNTW